MDTITIGRDNSCDIVVNNPRVSRIHANISKREGNTYVLRDMSTNGTIVNGIMIKGNELNIRYGDSVLLAGTMPLSWQKVQQLLPLDDENSYMNRGFDSAPQNNYGNNTNNCLETELSKFNWGAFGLNWIWGCANGMWWLLFVIFFLSFIPYISPILIIILDIVLGINGSRWAWKIKKWRSIDHFVSVQQSWKVWGIVFFCISIISCIICYFYLIVLGVSLWGM